MDLVPYSYSASGSRRSRRLGPIALLTIFGICALVGGAPLGEAVAAGRVIRVSPSSDDVGRLQAALDAASVAGQGVVIDLAVGTFHVARPLEALNFSGTIRGAGMGRTTVLADGSSNPNGLFPTDGPSPLLFSFQEADVDRFGQPLARRSQSITMRDLTLGATGETVPHYDISADADTQRLFSLVWIAGFRDDWTNSHGQTPGDTGFIDAEHAEVSTVRTSFTRVHFDGRNAARGDEPGGPFDPNPDVRNAFGIEGGFALIQPLPDPIYFFKPINASLAFANSRFTDLPGQAGIFAAQLVGPRDRFWTFGPDAVAAGLRVTDTVFRDTFIGVVSGDLSDVQVSIDHAAFRRTDTGVLLSTNYEATDGGVIGYPKHVAGSRVTIRDSTFKDSNAAAVWMDEHLGPSHVDFLTRGNTFNLTDPSQVAVLANSVDDARFVGNRFFGEGYGALVAVTSRRWLVQDNDFCKLHIPPSATASPVLGLPPNETQRPIVLFDSTQFRRIRNRCS